MASGTATDAYHSTLTASTVDTVTLTSAAKRLRIINRSGTAEIYYTTNGSAPTVFGANCYVVVAAITEDSARNELGDQNETKVQLISSGTPTYSVEVDTRTESR